MALSFASAVGNLFDRIGKAGLLVKQARSYQDSQLTNMTNATSGVVAQFNGESDIQAIMGSSYIGALNSIGSIGSTARSIARAAIDRMVYRDNPRANQTLTSQNVLESIREVLRQMKLAGATVLAQTIAATPTAFTGTGNAAVVTSTRRPFDGLVQEHSLAETLLLTCSADSYAGGVTAGNESILVVGEGSQSNPFAFDWPLGSGANLTVSVIDGGSDNTAGNLLTNSGFENWTNNVPNNWTLEVGTPGLHINKENSLSYDPPPNSAIRITGDSGSTLTRLAQKFDDSTAGTAGKLEELTQYGFNVFARRDGAAAAAGVLTVELVDGNGTVIKDENNASNTFTIDLTALSTVYTAYNTVFRTPRIMPSAAYLRPKLTTALTNGRSVYLDKMSLGLMNRVYQGGPYLSVHGGSVRLIEGDFATVAVTNSRGSGGTLDTWQTLFWRLFTEMASNDLMLPSSATPTVADGLIG